MKLALCMWDYRVFARFHEVHHIKTWLAMIRSESFIRWSQMNPKWTQNTQSWPQPWQPALKFSVFDFIDSRWPLCLYTKDTFTIALLLHLCTSTQNLQIIIYLRLYIYIYVESALQFFPAEKMILIPSHFQQVFHRERLKWMGQAGNHPVVVPNHINMLEVGGSRGGFWSKSGAPEGLRYLFLLKWISACAYSPI